MISILEYVLILSALGSAFSYLYMINVIRNSDNISQEAYDNLFVINVIKVYIVYINFARNDKIKRKIVLCFHIVLLVITLLLGYFFGENVS